LFFEVASHKVDMLNNMEEFLSRSIIVMLFLNIGCLFGMNFEELKGKIALVTGSTSGIGLAIATELAKNGVHIMLNGFGDVETAKDQVSIFGTKVYYHGADLSKPEEIENLFEVIREKFGGLDILVNNAGIQCVAPIESFPIERWNAIIAINLTAPFLCTRLAAPIFKERGWGRIINVASTHGLVASVNKSAYVAAKHGVIGLTKEIALETAATAVTCNAICPGWVLTPLVEKQIADRARQKGTSFDEEKYALVAEKHPSGNFVTPEQVAGAVLFFCSSSTSEVRGTFLAMDGGWTAQ
jgi:3-hydroxybutyrate dehydrogenase